MARLFSTRPHYQPVKGLYLWGGVGRGKTYLVDLFFRNLPLRSKKRIHFHRFMRQVHQQLRQHRHLQDPLKKITIRFAREFRVLCFDENGGTGSLGRRRSDDHGDVPVNLQNKKYKQGRRNHLQVAGLETFDGCFMLFWEVSHFTQF